MSGGVGKSTLTYNLAYHLHHNQGARVLIVDCDPQASLTTFMGKSPNSFSKTLTNSILDPDVPLEIVREFDWCHLAPTNINLATCEVKLGGVMEKERQLQKVLAKEEQNYDVILLDCPPSLAQIAINCLAAAQKLLVPIQTEYKSVEATINLLRFTVGITKQLNPRLDVFGIVPTMFDSRVKSHNIAIQTIDSMFEKLKVSPVFAKTKIFEPVPRGIDFATATRKHIPLAVLNKKHKALKVLDQIALEMYPQTSQLKEIVNA